MNKALFRQIHHARHALALTVAVGVLGMAVTIAHMVLLSRIVGRVRVPARLGERRRAAGHRADHPALDGPGRPLRGRAHPAAVDGARTHERTLSGCPAGLTDLESLWPGRSRAGEDRARERRLPRYHPQSAALRGSV